MLVASYELLGRFEDATRVMSSQRCWGMSLDGTQMLEAFRAGGREAYYRKRLELMDANGARPHLYFGYAIAHRLLGEDDKAIDYLERMVDAHVGGVVFIGVDSTLGTLSGHPRYDAVVKRAGLPTVSTRRTALT